MDYDKQPTNVEEQVTLLQNRGLVIEDIATAKLQLRSCCSSTCSMQAKSIGRLIDS